VTDSESSFRTLEKSGWETAVADYEDAFARLAAQSIGPLLDALQLKRGARLLDAACGAGALAAEAARRGIQARGVDFSAAMVALAKERHSKLRFEEGDVEALPFPDACFDGVAMNFGLLHLDQPERALAEAARVLKPGGRCGFTVWAAPPATAAYRIVLGAIEQHGRMDVALPPGPPFFRFADADTVSAALRAAGLVEPQVITVPQVWRFERAEELFEAMLRGTVRTAALLRAQAPDALAAIRRAVTAGAAAFATDEGIAMPMPAVLATARRS
jgi:SAM-dependent methyltransferase